MEPARFGRWIIVLGLLGCLRVFSEGLQVYRFAMTIYFVIAGVDLLVALATIAVGVALRRGKPWSPRAAASVGGFTVPYFFGVGALLAPETIAHLQALICVENAILVPRFANYLVAAVVWAPAVRVLLRDAPPGSRRSLLLWLGAAFVAGGVVGAIFFIQGR